MVSGGISNVSFSFRGNNPVREAIHAVFLFHAIAAGLDMGIVNAGALVRLRPRSTPSCASGSRTSSSTAAPDAAERLLEIAERVRRRRHGRPRPRRRSGARCRSRERITHALVKGIDAYVEADTEELRAEIAAARRPPDRGDRGPADGRHERRRRPVRRRQDVPAPGGEVGPGDEEGRRLPDPVHRGGEASPGDAERSNGTIVMATVKGDVHDIGKNIVGVVLQCNNYDVIDLGVMVPAQKILDAAKEHDADIIGLSGLITPSLDEMVNFAAEMERQGFEIPLLIGGATTSRAHTAVKVDRDVPRSGGLGEGRLPLGAGRRRAARRRAAAGAAGGDRGRLRRRCASGTPPSTTGRCCRSSRRARTRTPIDWTGYRRRARACCCSRTTTCTTTTAVAPASCQHVKTLPRLPARPSCASTSTGSRSSTPGR